MLDRNTLEALLLSNKITTDVIQFEDEWTPLREAWRGSDHTLGNRWEERQVFVQGRALSGHTNAGDMVKELEDAGFVVLGYVETAQSAKQPMLTVVDDRNEFHGLEPGVIDVAVQITLVLFRKQTVRAQVEDPSLPDESPPVG